VGKKRLAMASASAALVAVATGLFFMFWHGSAAPPSGFDLEGHRGTRGHAPENTLAAFRKAMQIGVTSLEMDLALTRDGTLVISHNPALNPDITRGPDGKFLTATGPAIHDLTLAALQTYDIGRLNPDRPYARQFPAQQASDGERFPTLQQVIDLVRDKAVRLDMEIKTDPTQPQLTADVPSFARAVVDLLHREKIADRVTVESFDLRALMAVKRLDPTIVTACLTLERGRGDTVQAGRPGASPWLGGLDIDDFNGNLPALVKKAGCEVWSPYFHDASDARLKAAHDLGLKVVVWTVNDPGDIATALDRGVDGIISDYPDRVRDAMKSRGMTLPQN
jgi:glycerophosphoryl diester phosphodiesterase